jgi:hypothetical protein
VSEVTYTAAAGESNKVSAAVDRARVTIDDPGAGSITAQQGCVNETPKRVVCDLQSSTTTIDYVLAFLGDGNDTFELSAANTPFAGARVVGGSGNDDLRGGPFADLLSGDVGIDELRGGDGADSLILGDATGSADADTVDGGADIDFVHGYAERTRPVLVDLASGTPAGEAGEGDRLTDVEGVTGGVSDDTLRGSDGSNYLNGGLGNDTIDGRGGPDSLSGGDGNDTVIGAGGADDIEAGNGDDLIRLDNEPGVYDRYVFCSDGNDIVTGRTEAFPSVGIDCELLDLGGGMAVRTLPRRVTTTYISMSIPCSAPFRDANGVCAGKLVVEPRLAFRRSATTRHRTRYGAKEFRFTTTSARITVPMNARGRKELRKEIMRLQFTLRLENRPLKEVRQFEWTETLNRRFLKQRGVG